MARFFCATSARRRWLCVAGILIVGAAATPSRVLSQDTAPPTLNNALGQAQVVDASRNDGVIWLPRDPVMYGSLALRAPERPTPKYLLELAREAGVSFYADTLDFEARLREHEKRREPDFVPEREARGSIYSSLDGNVGLIAHLSEIYADWGLGALRREDRTFLLWRAGSIPDAARLMMRRWQEIDAARPTIVDRQPSDDDLNAVLEKLKAPADEAGRQSLRREHAAWLESKHSLETALRLYDVLIQRGWDGKSEVKETITEAQAPPELLRAWEREIKWRGESDAPLIWRAALGGPGMDQAWKQARVYFWPDGKRIDWRLYTSPPDVRTEKRHDTALDLGLFVRPPIQLPKKIWVEVVPEPAQVLGPDSLNFEAENQPLAQVLAQVTKQSGARFGIADTPLEGARLTVRVHNQSLGQFLSALSRLYLVRWEQQVLGGVPTWTPRAVEMKEEERAQRRIPTVQAYWADNSNTAFGRKAVPLAQMLEDEVGREALLKTGQEEKDGVGRTWGVGVAVADLSPDTQAALHQAAAYFAAYQVVFRFPQVEGVTFEVAPTPGYEGAARHGLPASVEANARAAGYAFTLPLSTIRNAAKDSWLEALRAAVLDSPAPGSTVRDDLERAHLLAQARLAAAQREREANTAGRAQ